MALNHGVREQHEAAYALSPTQPDGAQAHSAAVRRQLLVAFSLLFIAAMAAAAWWGSGDSDHLAYLGRLLAMAVALPVGMALLARRVLAPMDVLQAEGDRLRGLYQDARTDALSDPLTGLGNHRAFQEELARQIEEARRYEYPVSLALIDLDDLKRTNDERGHAAGDRVLAAMGKLIATTMRAGDRGFRIGGDEFAILLPHSDVAAAHASIRRLLVMALGDEGATHSRPVFSFSGGVTSFPELTQDATRLRRQADAALYWAKRHGRTDVQAYDAERHGTADDHRATPELAAAVADVVERKALTARYQTIYDLRTGEPLGIECLVRPDESTEFSDAISLFVAAEATERSVELDLAAIEVVAGGIELAADSTYVSLNLSPRTLETEHFRVADVLGVLARHSLDPSRIVIELTEREAIEDIERLQANLEACRAAGMRIAADDVGAGNAGLWLLSHVEFDLVKVDLSLVQGGVLRDAALGVLRAIQGLAERSGATVIAEGIETAEQLSVVRRLGIGAGQGYLLGRPLPVPTAYSLDIDSLEAALDPVEEYVDPRLVVIGLKEAPLEPLHSAAPDAAEESGTVEPAGVAIAQESVPSAPKARKRRGSPRAKKAKGAAA